MILEKNKLDLDYFLQFKYQVRSFLSLHPQLFFPLVDLKQNSRQLAVDNNTEIVIEGFPRSGNSFAVGAFRAAHSYPVSIATHLHAPAQIIVATRKNIPTLVVIRNPIDAVISLKALHLECNNKALKTKSSFCDFKVLLKSYINFYKTIAPYRDKYVLGYFDELTKDFSQIIIKINQHFNTDFKKFEHTKSNMKKVFERQGFHAGPSIQRQELKKILRTQIEQTKFKPLLAEATEVYQQFLSFSK